MWEVHLNQGRCRMLQNSGIKKRSHLFVAAVFDVDEVKETEQTARIKKEL